ncbi:hypothetical protein NSP_5350 [Nodularia spumigena CCY9414]|nr:hypothetical protein NSP_5350 [Nodularia spumigena CCY9414]
MLTSAGLDIKLYRFTQHLITQQLNFFSAKKRSPPHPTIP